MYQKKLTHPQMVVIVDCLICFPRLKKVQSGIDRLAHVLVCVSSWC